MIRCILILTLCFVQRTYLEKIVKFSNIQCDCNANYFKNCTCELKVRGRDLVVSNGQFDLLVNVKNTKIHIELFKSEYRFQPYILNSTFHICDALKSNGITDILIQTIIASLKDYSNIISCGHEVRFAGNSA